MYHNPCVIHLVLQNSAHQLLTEQGRYYDITRSQTKCICASEDGFHFILIGLFDGDIRSIY